MKDSEIIDLYIRNELSKSGRHSFEERLLTDTDFKKEYESILDLQQGIRLAHLEGKLDFLKDVQAQKKSDPKTVHLRPNKMQWLTKLSIAATIVLALGTTIWIVLDPPTHNSETLFAQNFHPDDHYFTSRSDSTDTRQDCYSNYSNEQWEAAISCIQQLLDSENQSIDHYYLGIAYLGINKSKEAIQQFDLIRVVPDLITADQLFWYKGLAYIYDGQLDRAISTLETVSGDRFGGSAQKLMADLKKLQAL